MARTIGSIIGVAVGAVAAAVFTLLNGYGDNTTWSWWGEEYCLVVLAAWSAACVAFAGGGDAGRRSLRRRLATSVLAVAGWVAVLMFALAESSLRGT